MVYITLIVAGVIISTLERLPGIRFRKAPFFRGFFASDVFYLLTGFVAGTSLTYSFIFSASATLRSAGVPRLSEINLPGWVLLTIAMISLDLGNYGAHWLMHRFDALWTIHKVHHSSLSLDWLSTFRSHILEQILRRLLAPVVLILMGLPTDVVALAGSLFYAWAMFIHSNVSLNLRWIEPVLVTPRLHRRHHDSNAETMNLGTVLTLWDHLLGTFDSREPATEVVFGVPGEVDTYPQGWWKQFFAALLWVRPGSNQ